MLIPYSTDAPIYHYPIATVALIIVNVVCFFAFCIGMSGSSRDDIEYFIDVDGNKVEKFEAVESLQNLEEGSGDADQLMRQLTPVQNGTSDWRTELLLQYGKGFRPWCIGSNILTACSCCYFCPAQFI